MIKLINTGETKVVANQIQIEQFAFLDTKQNRFLRYNKRQVWYTWDEFLGDFQADKVGLEAWIARSRVRLHKLYLEGKR